jgi:hypothetical protein
MAANRRMADGSRPAAVAVSSMRLLACCHCSRVRPAPRVAVQTSALRPTSRSIRGWVAPIHNGILVGGRWTGTRSVEMVVGPGSVDRLVAAGRRSGPECPDDFEGLTERFDGLPGGAALDLHGDHGVPIPELAPEHVCNAVAASRTAPVVDDFITAARTTAQITAECGNYEMWQRSGDASPRRGD